MLGMRGELFADLVELAAEHLDVAAAPDASCASMAGERIDLHRSGRRGWPFAFLLLDRRGESPRRLSSRRERRR